MNNFRADIHCHTTFSDGTYTPEELIDLALKKGLNGLSITDHDTVDAYTCALPYAKQRGLALLGGIEFSSVHKESNVHVLGYAFDLQNKALLDLCKRHRTRREARNLAIIEQIQQKGMDVSVEDLYDKRYIPKQQQRRQLGRPHIAQVLMAKKYVSTIQEAFNTYLGDNASCYVAGEKVSVEETIATIHQARGKAVIAHPHLFKNPSIIQELEKMSFDGIEGYYSLCGLKQEQPWIDFAKKKGWFVTGGSDFHGEIKPRIYLACSWIGNEVFDTLYRHFIEQNKAITAT
ncbi:PHP domain-containing protein [Simkania negevensis]|uniref:PHP domain-containing protein n=1 Tax=Simkania negevensis TaxID=83561 RepID=A0ABS3AQS0_9BACT|nr:PHP domain-containing protein [Simkania negevensis]